MAKNVRKIRKRTTDDGISVREVAEAYLSSAHVRRLSARTQKTYNELLTFVSWAEDHKIQLHQVRDQIIFEFLEHIKATHKPRRNFSSAISTHTLHKYVRMIKSFLNWCLLDDEYSQYVKAITIQRIEMPTKENVIIETFNVQQIDALFQACDKEQSEHLRMRDRAILSVLLDSGLRAQELCGLTIGNISLDPKDSYVRIFGKGRKWGEVGLGEQSRRNVQKYIRTFREPTIEYSIEQEQKNVSPRQLSAIKKDRMQQELVFVNRSGDRLTDSGLYRIIERLGRWSGIDLKRCSPHIFRHTFAVMFIRSGGDIYTLSKLLRHSSVKTTEEYLKSLMQTEARHGALSVLDNLEKVSSL